MSGDDDRVRRGVFTIANAVTLARLVLIPCFGFLWWRGQHGAALAVFAGAALSDWLDGFLARVLDQRTRLGQILDPAADKLLLLVSFLTAAAPNRGAIMANQPTAAASVDRTSAADSTSTRCASEPMRRVTFMPRF